MSDFDKENDSLHETNPCKATGTHKLFASYWFEVGQKTQQKKIDELEKEINSLKETIRFWRMNETEKKLAEAVEVISAYANDANYEMDITGFRWIWEDLGEEARDFLESLEEKEGE
jgi:uncharacterized protein YacL (UPF0231 family)